MICVLLVSCQPKKTQTAQDASFLISNISDSASKTEVMNDLQQVISAKSVARFFAAVEDYNDTIKHTSLTKGFVHWNKLSHHSFYAAWRLDSNSVWRV